MHDLHTKTALDKKALQFTYSRLQSLLRTLEITSLEEFNPLQDVANFATLVATYVEGFSVILEPRVLPSSSAHLSHWSRVLPWLVYLNLYFNFVALMLL